MTGRREKVGLGAADLLLVRAAMHAGATPAQALQVLPADGPHEAVIAQVRGGATLADVVDGSDSSLIRALAVAEVAGAAASPAIDGLIDATLASRRLADLVAARSAQARLTARLLVAFPLTGAGLITMADPAARQFLGSTLGLLVLAVAGALIGTAWLWINRLVAGVDRAVLAMDPLLGPPGSGHDSVVLPTVEALDLLAIGLSAGLSLGDATALVGVHGPTAVTEAMAATARSVRAGLPIADAFPDGLAEAAALLAVADRWGAPAAPALRLLARDLRERATFAAEAAAERLAVHLVFPTTLLLVPAFGLLVVAPLLASAIDGFDLGL